MTVRLFLLSAIAALPACSVMRAPSRMDEAGLATPGSWESTRQAQAGVDTDWVRQFGDSTLTSLVKTALDANPDLKIAAAKVDQARADIRAAGAKLQPMVDGGLTGTRTKRNFIGFPIGGQTQGQPGAAEQVSSSLSNTFGLSLDVQWELDVWGRIRAGASAAAAAAEAVEADYRAARASLGAQVARGYFTVVEANRQAQLAEEALKVYEDTAKAIEDRSAPVRRMRAALARSSAWPAAMWRLPGPRWTSGRARRQTRCAPCRRCWEPILPKLRRGPAGRICPA